MVILGYMVSRIGVSLGFLFFVFRLGILKFGYIVGFFGRFVRNRFLEFIF